MEQNTTNNTALEAAVSAYHALERAERSLERNRAALNRAVSYLSPEQISEYFRRTSA